MASRLAGLALVWMMIVAPAAAQADARSDARDHFLRGLSLFRSSEYGNARAEFEAAYRALPDARVLANIAACHSAEGRPVAALRMYRRFLSEGQHSVPLAARRQAEREVARLRARVGEIAIAVEPVGAEILVDGESVGRAPLPWPVAAAPGIRLVEVRAEGRRPVSRTLNVMAASQLTASIVLEPLRREREPRADLVEPSRAAPVAATREDIGRRERGAPEDEPTPLGRGALFWTGAALTVALGAAGGLTGALALERKQQYEDPETSPRRRRQLYDETRRWAVATDILLDSAIVLGLASLALFVFAGPDDEPERDDGEGTRPSLTLRGGLDWNAAIAF